MKEVTIDLWPKTHGMGKVHKAIERLPFKEVTSLQCHAAQFEGIEVVPGQVEWESTR